MRQILFTLIALLIFGTSFSQKRLLPPKKTLKLKVLILLSPLLLRFTIQPSIFITVPLKKLKIQMQLKKKTN